MKHKLILVMSVLLSFSLFLSGCSVTAPDLMANVEAARWPENPPEPDDIFIDSARVFSWNLFQLSASAQGNVMVSPASVYIALVMALNGANNETKDAIIQTLAPHDLSVDDLNIYVRDWITLLTRNKAKIELSIANSIWYREGFVPDKEFLQRNADFIGAAALSLDFSDSGAVRAINNWVKEATKGTIDEIVESIDEDVMMYLINALYFKSDWQNQFEASDTSKGNFTTPSGSVDVDYMNRQGNMEYFTYGSAEGILLPYTDERFAFMALIPEEDQLPRQLIEEMNHDTINEIINGRYGRSIDLFLPKFEVSYEDSLNDHLTAMGMGIAFDPNRADFSLMRENRNRDLYISDVKHKTFIRVDEKGTEAAAVTSIEMRVTSIPAGDYELRFDRPFIYALLDIESGLPLFIGIMENPSE